MCLSLTHIYKRFFAEEEHRLLLHGLNSAGKTTILYRLRLGEAVTTIPSVSFMIENTEYELISFTASDLRTRDKIRPLWRHYFTDAKAVVFVVDCADRDHIEDSRRELVKLLNEGDLRDAVLLVIANKQDLPNAMTAEELIETFGFCSTCTRRWFVQAACATTGDGLLDGLEWLHDVLTKKKVQTTRSGLSSWLNPKTWFVAHLGQLVQS
eukprot:TRINITY_DN20904_c0_g1_i1.p1 TRINITY_DN20904_c0_g1~~TRINITY_DN20904_c0_g1_i1.p1  ORF type:complete len:210 (-),score=22.19 TRINITY_DN20904_c0_g1_i1:112-741(-)